MELEVASLTGKLDKKPRGEHPTTTTMIINFDRRNVGRGIVVSPELLLLANYLQWFLHGRQEVLPDV